MSDERNAAFAERVEAIFGDAIELPPAERDAFVRGACGGDHRLLDEVLALLGADREAGAFLEQHMQFVIASGAQQREPRLRAGDRAAAYEIVVPIGSGAMGEVYRARDLRLGREVALKVLPAGSDWSHGGDAVARFRREARTASALNDPAIVHIYDIGQAEAGDETIHYIAMELIEGVTLRERFATTRDAAQRLRYLLDVARGLARAHAAGVVHRDLKPENIMTTPDGRAKIVDFGLAKLVEPVADGESLFESRAGMLIGTAGYMSPEQILGGTADERSDIFAFGCIVYEAATGVRAFQGKSIIDTLHQIVHATPPPLRAINRRLPRPLQALVDRCIAKQPHDRYPSIATAAADLERAIERMPRRSTISQRPAAASTPRRVRVAVAAAGLLIAVGAATLDHYRSGATPASLLSFTAIERTPAITRSSRSREDVDPVAYDLWLKGRHEWNRWTKEGWLAAIGHFEGALEREPLYALAHCGIADSYTQLALYHMLPPEEAWPKAKAAAVKAVEIDSTLAGAHMALGVIRTWYEHDFERAEESYLRAIELDPGFTEGHLAYSRHLDVLGRHAEAVQSIEKARALNPVSQIVQIALTDSYRLQRDGERYLALSKKMAEMFPDSPNARAKVAEGYAMLGNEAAAFEEHLVCDRLQGATPEELAASRRAYERDGLRGYWRVTARRDAERWPREQHMLAVMIASEYLLAGDTDEALRWTKISHDRREAFLLWARVDPDWAAARADARFARFLPKVSAE